MIGLILSLLVTFVSAQELDFHGDPFALPPYSWKELDITWNKGQDVIWYAGNSINERLLNKGIGPAQIIKSNAIWTRSSKTNPDPKASAISYISYNYIVIARDQTIFECMTPMEEYTIWEQNWIRSGNMRVFDTTCRPVTMRNCQSNEAENKIVIDRKSPEALEAREAINNFIDKTLNPQRFEQLLYKVDVLMGVSCAYKQDDKICLDLYEQRISDEDVELRPCSGCMQKKADGTWDFGKPTCYPGNPFMIN